MLGVVLMLITAAFIGWIADMVVPGRLPLGWIGSIMAGLVGAWIGTAIIGEWGPTVGGLALVPGIIGAVIFAFLVRILLGSANRQRV